jgi:hypothetical protein
MLPAASCVMRPCVRWSETRAVSGDRRHAVAAMPVDAYKMKEVTSGRGHRCLRAPTRGESPAATRVCAAHRAHPMHLAHTWRTQF